MFTLPPVNGTTTIPRLVPVTKDSEDCGHWWKIRWGISVWEEVVIIVTIRNCWVRSPTDN